MRYTARRKLCVVISAELLRVQGWWIRGILIAVIVGVDVFGLTQHHRNDLANDAVRGWDRAAAY